MKGVSLGQLANKCGTDKTHFYQKMKDPNKLTLREARCIAVCLDFTPEEIYNSFICMYGWEKKYVEGTAYVGRTNGKVSGKKSKTDTKGDKE
jgi:hypothetical protein